MVKMGSINMAKAIRRIGHRSGQARKMTFYRDAIESKDDYGVEIDTIASGNEGLTIPNIDTFIAPIVTSSDSLTRAGHTVIGSANLYIPALSTIKNNVLGISDSGAHNARLSSFNELESKDILYDMEKIIYSADSATIKMATQGLYSRYQKAMGTEPNLVSGKSGTSGVSAFRSTAEVVTAMQDPRYGKDVTYTENVQNRLAESNVFNVKG